LNGEVRYFMRHSLAVLGHLGLKALGLLPFDGNSSASDDQSAITAMTGIPRTDIIRLNNKNGTFSPNNVISIDRRVAAVVVCFRGTMSPADVLTDLCCDQVPFNGGYAHRGMLESSDRFLEENLCEIETLLRDDPSLDSLIFCGHSLGGGLATLVAARLGATHAVPRRAEGVRVRCFAFGVPCVGCPKVSASVKDFVVALINENDMVPRFGLGRTKDLRDASVALHREGLVSEITKLSADLSPSPRAKMTREEYCVWGRNILTWLQREHMVHPKLHVCGTVLWIPPPKDATLPESWNNDTTLRHCDVLDFSSTHICSSMFSAHMPQAYAYALGAVGQDYAAALLREQVKL
jgi:hypothetical protein